MVPRTRLELAHLAVLAPETSVSTRPARLSRLATELRFRFAFESGLFGDLLVARNAHSLKIFDGAVETNDVGLPVIEASLWYDAYFVVHLKL